MPIFEYGNADRSIVVEQIYLKGADAPDKIEVVDRFETIVLKKLPSVFRPAFNGPASGGTTHRNGLIDTRELATPHEVKKHARSCRQSRIANENATRQKIIGDCLRTFDL